MKPTVLHVLEAFAGGTERHLLDLVRHVEDFEHVLAVPHVHLGTGTQRASGYARAAGARVEPVDMRRSASPVRNLAALHRLRGIIRRLKPDVVHGHSSVGGAFARVASVGSGRPVVYTPNGLSRARWALAIERSLARGTGRIIAVSPSEYDFALLAKVADAQSLELIPNGIDLEPPPSMEPSLRSRLGIPDDVPLVGSLGRLTWQKAPEVYVSACANVAKAVPDAHFLLIGSGPEAPAVAREIERGGIGPRFHRLAELPGASAAFAELDLYVLASRFEGGPYTVLEAMRAGTPVVATAAVGSKDAIEDGVSGLLVPVDDPDALGAAMSQVLRDAHTAQAIGEAGRRRLTERYDVKAMASATSRVYAALAGMEGAPLNRGHAPKGARA